ncbi:hypothetical protein PSQ90_03180 [Devosia rhodophyticola]|uniref:DUF2946 domain-containing protein n=1 Tax=Devosia rhodophyticola TaxID=3026423 RepID=A0ABY7YYP7_9HYPH|nr:hypothetical protein [Devosia rhodophyticola]WDR06486.1 hypothetical protein PSQ90_03180 [Devosia rhodophyticola]
MLERRMRIWLLIALLSLGQFFAFLPTQVEAAATAPLNSFSVHLDTACHSGCAISTDAMESHGAHTLTGHCLGCGLPGAYLPLPTGFEPDTPSPVLRIETPSIVVFAPFRPPISTIS